MPEITAEYKHLDGLELPNLHARYNELKASLTLLPDGTVNPNVPQDDEILRELCAILAQLRKRSSGPPKRKAPAGPSNRKAQPLPETAIEDL
jgi:hypothetical protein